jgi:tetratricopeptide (TPR) repeat protein
LLSHADVKVFVYLILFCFPSYGIAMNNATAQSLERVMEYIQSGNSSEAFRILSGYQPSSRDLSLYHYAYAKAYELSKRQYDSIAHFRLAYLYSKDEEMKERTLIERAEAYAKIGFHSEAALIFRIFLKNFPHSQYEERALLGLADSSYRLGLFSEAKEAYERAGNSSRSLYGKANALHSMGKVKDAHEIYLTMLEKDRGYVESSQETLYNIGENLRLMGEFSSARIYFNSISESLWKNRAMRSLGLIELEEEHLDVAKKFFYSALQSPEKQLRRQVLLNLADIYLKQGRQEDAKSCLVEIRKQYPYGKDYDETLLMLSQLYKKEGNFKEATSLIKELVFRHLPNQRALDEFESLILEAEDKGGEEFLKLWRAVGHWLLQPSRSQSILKIGRASCRERV